MTGRGRPSPDIITETAAQWLLELETASSDRLAEFAAWLRVSPLHVEEFLMVTAIAHELEAIDPRHRQQIDSLVAEARATTYPLLVKGRENIVPSSQKPSKPWLVGSTVVAACAAGLVGLAILNRSARSETFATGVAEQRTIKLADGSLIFMNARSQLTATLGRSERRIDLTFGEALFKVRHDAVKPFRVSVANTTVEAVGTEFDVASGVRALKVFVTEGQVRVSIGSRTRPESTHDSGDGRLPGPAAHISTVSVTAGQEASVTADEISMRSAVASKDVLAWRERRLVFRGETLDEVASSFNRYNRLQIQVEDDRARSQRVSGVFDADNVQAFLQFLEREPGLTVERGRESVVVRNR